MALFGKGVLAIWNDIEPSAEADFLAWHVQEHIPERVGLTGFLRGRRYVATDGHSRYFNFYETELPDTLSSDEYLARLNAPSDWTRQVVSHFRDTSRTVCAVVASLGRGEGSWIETIRLSQEPKTSKQWLFSVAATTGVTGAHLLRALPPKISSPTAELKLRGHSDETVPWILLVEAVEPEPILQLRTGLLNDEQILGAPATDTVERGLYRLQFSLSKTELTAENTR